MARKKLTVARIDLDTDKPTHLTFKEIYSWVIWQFPRRISGGFCGAVRPPIPHHDWYPALIQQKEKRVQIYAHLNETFATPEAAADHLHQNGR